MFKRWLGRIRPSRPLQPLPSRDAYALWAASYPPEAHNPFMQLEQRAMLDLMPPLAGRVVLDLASGSGRYGLLAAKAGAGRVLAVDNSADMLRANSLPLRALASVAGLPLADNCVDVVLCALAIGHVEALDAAVGEIGRVLRAGGTALVSDLHPFLSLSGAQRTFRAGGALYAVEHYTHLYGDVQRAASGAGLYIDALREPALDGGVMPVVIVYRLLKS